MDLSGFSTHRLLTIYAGVLTELEARGVTRTANNPMADFAEGLFCGACGWERQHGEEVGCDAIDLHGVRYEIKARRKSARAGWQQVSAIRSLTTFDALAAVLFHPDFTIMRAALIPVGIIADAARFEPRTGSHNVRLTDNLLAKPSVIDVTDCLRAFMTETHQ